MKNLVKKILKNSPDPLKVRKSTATVFVNLNYIDINLEEIKPYHRVLSTNY